MTKPQSTDHLCYKKVKVAENNGFMTYPASNVESIPEANADVTGRNLLSLNIRDVKSTTRIANSYFSLISLREVKRTDCTRLACHIWTPSSLFRYAIFHFCYTLSISHVIQCQNKWCRMGTKTDRRFRDIMMKRVQFLLCARLFNKAKVKIII